MSAEVIMITPPDPERLAWYEENDLGNAERLKARSGGLLLYVSGKGWTAYDGRRWSTADGDRKAAQAAHDVARSIRDEVKALGDQIRSGRLPRSMVEAAGEEKAREMAQDKLVNLHKWAVKSGNAAQTRGMLAQAADELVVDLDAFDTDPYAFNCLNKTIRFVQDLDAPAGEQWRVVVRDHDPMDMISHLAQVEYHPEAQCPAWRERLELVQPDGDQREQLQDLIGYCMTGLTSEQQFYIWQGPGGDGKSATAMVISKLWGDYHRRAKVQSFLEGPQRGGSDHSSDIARLSGDVRLVTCSEPPKRSQWNVNLIKELTGGDKLAARALREAEIEFLPRWKLLIECNGFPSTGTSDDGWWRRVRAILWPFQFAKMGVAPEPPHILNARLMAEGPGILNWAIEGALHYLNHGKVRMSRTSKRAVDEYRRSSDPFDQWYLDRVVSNDRSVRTLATDLYTNFKAFCEEGGIEKIMTQKSFGLKLAEKQHESQKSNGVMYRVGIRFRTEAELREIDRRQEAEDAAAGLAVVQTMQASNDPGPPPVGWD